jgi:DNA-binding MarR family transcriptional regulator
VNERAASVNAWEALFRAQVTVLRELHTEFPTGHLSLNEYDVLFNLSRQPNRQLRLRDLNRHLLLTQPSVSRLVDRLTSRGLLRKENDPADGRATVVCLTDAGYRLFLTVAAPHSDSIARQLAALSPDELATLTAITDKLRRSIEDR